MKTRKWVATLILVLLVGGTCWADTVNINPYRIVLNADGQFDDVQANVPIYLPSGSVDYYDAELVIENGDCRVSVFAVSAYYCLIDHMLIIGFDRAELQDDLDEQDMGTTTAKATVYGTVNGISFSGSDTVEIVAPGKKK